MGASPAAVALWLRRPRHVRSDAVRSRLAEPAAPEGLSPTASDKVWGPSNCAKTLGRLYDQMADDLGIPLLREVSSHAWGATLDTEWCDRGVLPEVRAAHFGYSPETNLQYYTDRADVSRLVALVTGLDNNPS